MASCTSVEDMFTSLSLGLGVAQEKRVEKQPCQHQCQVVVGQPQIGGGGVLALGRRAEFRSRSRGILFQQTTGSAFDHAFCLCVGRVGNLTRQEDWYSLVLCRRRLAPCQGKRVAAQHGRPTPSRISICLMQDCIQGPTPE